MKKPETYGKRPAMLEWAKHCRPYMARTHWKSVRGIVRAYCRYGWMAEW